MLARTRSLSRARALSLSSVWVVFININDMYNNDVGKGGVRVYEGYEVK